MNKLKYWIKTNLDLIFAIGVLLCICIFPDTFLAILGFILAYALLMILAVLTGIFIIFIFVLMDG